MKVLLPILLFGFLLSPPAGVAPRSRMTLKDGRVFDLKEPPRLSGRRIVFTTAEGKVYSMDESEIVTISTQSPPAPPPRTYDPLDSHALGSIARQHRNRKGISTLLGRSPARPAHARRKPRRTSPGLVPTGPPRS